MESISLARGVPAPECIPVEELADCAQAAILDDGATALSYGAAGGYGPLRAWIAERHGVDAARVLVTNGSLQGFVFLAELLAGSGERVLVEAPTYDRPLVILDRLGAEIVAVPQADDGIDVDALAGELDGGGQRVMYSSSFSKIVAPGLRVGYLVLPEALAARVESLATSTYITPSLLSQATVYEFLRRGELMRNLELVRSLLKSRRDALVEALEEHLGATGARWNRPEGGYFLWLDLPAGLDAVELLRAAERLGVTFVPGPDFFPPGGGGRSAARLAFSFAAPSQLRDAVSRLATLVPSASAIDLRQQHA